MQVFLSHSGRDAAFTRRLYEAVRDAGLAPWAYWQDIPRNENFVAEINRSLEESGVVVLVWSAAARASEWTEREWTAALAMEGEKQRRFLGVVVLDEKPLPALLRTRNYTDGRLDQGKAIEDVVAWLRRQRQMRAGEAQDAPQLQRLDYRPSGFVGRLELFEQLHRELVEQPGRVLLHGEPGNGKSTLALEFAWRVRGAFEAVVFLTCGERETELVAADLAEKVKPEWMPLEPGERLKTVKHWLAGRRTLVVLDDVWAADVAELAPGPPVSVLYTSRDRAVVRLPPRLRMPVPGFSDAEREAFLEAQAVDAAWHPPLLKLAGLYQGSPLAMAAMAGQVADSSAPVAAVVAELQREGLKDVQALLARAAGRQPEQARLLKAFAACAGDTVWLPFAIEVAGMEESHGRGTANQLVNASLLRLVDRDDEVFGLHPLMKSALSEGGAALGARHEDVAIARFKDWEAGWEGCSRLLVEAEQALRGLVERRDARAPWHAYRVFALSRRVGRLDVAFRATEHWKAHAEALGNQDGLQAIYGNQALILKDWGRLDEAMALHRKKEEICRALGNQDSLQRSYGNQALILKAWGRLDEAMALLKKQEEICRALGNQDGLQRSYGNQALILQDWGQLDEAMALHKKKEEICRALGNQDSLQRSYGNQALILKAWDRLDEAMALHKKEEEICRALGDRSGLAYSQWGQGLIAQQRGDHAAARHLLEHALDTFTELRMPRERDGVRAALDELQE